MESHGPAIESSQKGCKVHAEEADGRDMSGVHQDGDMTAESLSLNASAALRLHDPETDAALSGENRSYCHHTIKISCTDAH